MKTICLNFNIHKALRLKKYDFFDMGHDNFYFDSTATRAFAETKSRDFICPALNTFLKLVKKYGDAFKFSMTISGFALALQEECSPEIIELLKKLVDTGCMELIGMPYYHSLASICDEDEFVSQVRKHSETISRLFGVTPVTFRNTELIYTDKIGLIASDLGFKTVLTEGVGESIDLNGTNFVYFNPLSPSQIIIARNAGFSRIMEDALKDNKLFSPEYFVGKLLDVDEDDEILYIGINFEYFDIAKFSNSEVLVFMEKFVDSLIESQCFNFRLPSEASSYHEPIGPYHVTTPVSGVPRKYDISPWQGNELQQEALKKITALGALVKIANSDVLTEIWRRLQCSDYFYFMSTDNLNYKTNPFKTPYDAFITYMHIIGDLTRRLEEKVKQEEADNMSEQQIKDVISFYEKEIVSLRRRLLDKE